MQDLAAATKAWSAANGALRDSPSLDAFAAVRQAGRAYVDALEAAGQAGPAGLRGFVPSWETYPAEEQLDTNE